MSAPPDLPAVVSRAFDVSRRHGYVSFCRNETGRLLATLAATRQGTLAEFGTGTGVGTAWLRSGIRNGAKILTAELDSKLAGAAAEIFSDDEQVEVRGRRLVDSARPRARSHCSSSTRVSPRTAAPTPSSTSIEPGGVVVLDDFTPCESWPPVYGGRVDVLREQWLTDDRFTTVEVMVAPDTSVLIATKR